MSVANGSESTATAAAPSSAIFCTVSFRDQALPKLMRLTRTVQEITIKSGLLS